MRNLNINRRTFLTAGIASVTGLAAIDTKLIGAAQRTFTRRQFLAQSNSNHLYSFAEFSQKLELTLSVVSGRVNVARKFCRKIIRKLINRFIRIRRSIFSFASPES